jgi:hypothetical protein
MAITQTAHDKTLQMPPVWCNELEVASIPIDLATTTGKRLLRVVLPATLAGDVLDITFKVGVTNNAGYTVGVGAHIWYYAYADPDGWANRVQISDMLTGQNVDTTIVHHLPLGESFSWRVPADWDSGRMVLALVVDAHSTAWKAGDTLKVETGYAQLRVHRWTSPPAAT